MASKWDGSSDLHRMMIAVKLRHHTQTPQLLSHFSAIPLPGDCSSQSSFPRVDVHPRIHCGWGNCKSPLFALSVVINITSTIIGPAHTPLSTALEKKPDELIRTDPKSHLEALRSL